MSRVTIEHIDGRETIFNPDDSRQSVIRRFCKATKWDDYAGKWGVVERNALYIIPPTTDRVVLENEKRYLLSPTRLTALTDYLANVKGTPWNRIWGARETTLLSAFSEAIPKDGT